MRPGRLLEIAGLIRRYLPEAETIGCFVRVTDTADKTDRELSALGEAGYDGITIGAETGDGQSPAFMDKGCRPEDILTQCRRLDRAAIRYSFFYLAGVSGAGEGEMGVTFFRLMCLPGKPARSAPQAPRVAARFRQRIRKPGDLAVSRFPYGLEDQMKKKFCHLQV